MRKLSINFSHKSMENTNLNAKCSGKISKGKMVEKSPILSAKNIQQSYSRYTLEVLHAKRPLAKIPNIGEMLRFEKWQKWLFPKGYKEV